jgi:hypothetical protein
LDCGNGDKLEHFAQCRDDWELDANASDCDPGGDRLHDLRDLYALDQYGMS